MKFYVYSEQMGDRVTGVALTVVGALHEQRHSHTRTHTFIDARTCIHTYKYHICIYIHINTTHANKYTHVYKHTYIHAYIHKYVI